MIDEVGYALLCDVSLNWRGVVYYIDRNAQSDQLVKAGFSLLKILDSSGTELKTTDDGSSSDELYYVCSKQ